MADYSPITIARFWSKVEVLPHSAGCWLWKANTGSAGYGKFRSNGVETAAHRAAWEIFNGPVLDGQVIRHKCDNPLCCNPAHLEPGTQGDNMADMVARGRSTRGAANGRALLTAADVATIRERIARGEPNTRIARDYPITHSMVSRIKRGLAWS
jgi:hypothetical protein